MRINPKCPECGDVVIIEGTQPIVTGQEVNKQEWLEKWTQGIKLYCSNNKCGWKASSIRL